MRKLVLVLALAILLIGPAAAQAAEFRRSELVTVGPDEVIRGDLYATGEAVRIEGRVEGDVFAAGGKVEITGTVTGDVVAAGGEVILRGTVGDDVRVAGGEVSIEGTVGDHALLAGGQVRLQSRADVRGDVHVAGGQVLVAGNTGSLTVRAGQVTVADTAHIRGDFLYASGRDTTLAQGATIDGAVRKESLPARGRAAGIAAFLGIFSFVSLAASFIVGLLVLRFLPNKSRTVITQWRARFWSNLLWGVLALVVTPLLGGMLIFTLVGAPLGIGVLLLYPILLYFGHIVSALAVGQWLRERMARQTDLAPNWRTLLLGLVVLTVVGFIPVLGDLAVLVAFLAGVGALARFERDLIKRLRADGVV